LRKHLGCRWLCSSRRRPRIPSPWHELDVFQSARPGIAPRA
jgi:hypothetical protein